MPRSRVEMPTLTRDGILTKLFYSINSGDAAYRYNPVFQRGQHHR
jgi:hypothetical protein